MIEKLPITRPPSLGRVFLSEGSSDRSDPILGLATELERLGVETLFSGGAYSHTPTWLNLAWQSQALIFVRYRDGDGKFLRRQLYRAKLLGCTVVRWWVGSDVLHSRQSEMSKGVARAVDEAVDLNIAVSPHLVEELDEIGIKAEYVPSLCDLSALENAAPPVMLPKGVLTYLPAKRRAFYGEKVLIAAVEANPDLKFFVVSDESHSLAHYPNVESLGWVDDMESVWSKVGLLLRVTKHDGMPRMVLEALARSRYVIYSHSFEGCWYAKSSEEVLQQVERFKALDVPNSPGPQITRSASVNAGAFYVEKIAGRLSPPLSASRMKAIVTAARHIR